MIDALSATRGTVRTAYNRRSGLYDRTVARAEWPAHLQALDALALQPADQVLDVAVGPGRSTIEIARRVDPRTEVWGVDLSDGMLRIAEGRARTAGVANARFRQADAAALPFPSSRFDAVYNAYMLDLIPFGDMASILGEFYRVLKPGGRLVLLNMSKEADDRPDWRETAYRLLPRLLPESLVWYVGGGCRPVLMADAVRAAGFDAVSRRFLARPLPSEIIAAVKRA